MSAIVRLSLVMLLCCTGWLLVPREAAAQNLNCNFTPPLPGISLGSVGGAGGSSQGSANFTCTNWEPTERSITVCLFMNPSNPTGVAPRRMVNWSANPQSLINYDLYADPAHTQILGSESSGHTIHATTFQIGGFNASNNWTPQIVEGSLPVYAHVPAGQSVANGNYVSQMTPMLHYVSHAGTNNPPTAAECAAGPAAQNYSEVTAQGVTGCQLGTATDMDFGIIDMLDTAHVSSSTVQVFCPPGQEYTVGLSAGNHSPDDFTRRMKRIGGSEYVQYELYRASSRTAAERWGIAPDERVEGTGNGSIQTLNIYGLVPAQATPASGEYSDQVTVTVFY